MVICSLLFLTNKNKECVVHIYSNPWVSTLWNHCSLQLHLQVFYEMPQNVLDIFEQFSLKKNITIA